MADEVLYRVDGKLAHITLNRPDRLNAISETLPSNLQAAVERANADGAPPPSFASLALPSHFLIRVDAVHVIVLTGAGRAFCSGWDLKRFAETPRPTLGSQNMPWGAPAIALYASLPLLCLTLRCPGRSHCRLPVHGPCHALLHVAVAEPQARDCQDPGALIGSAVLALLIAVCAGLCSGGRQ